MRHGDDAVHCGIGNEVELVEKHPAFQVQHAKINESPFDIAKMDRPFGAALA